MQVPAGEREAAVFEPDAEPAPAPPLPRASTGAAHPAIGKPDVPGAEVASRPWSGGETAPGSLASRHDAEDDDEDGFELRARRLEDDGLDMTPMVDVTFLLLIFFMITASFSLQKSMETEAPESEQEGFAQMPTIEDLADDSVIVAIDEKDALFVDDVPVSGPGELQEVLLRKMSAEQKREMIIEAHYQATHGIVVAVTDAAVEVGMQRVRRVSQSAGASGP